MSGSLRPRLLLALVATLATSCTGAVDVPAAGVTDLPEAARQCPVDRAQRSPTDGVLVAAYPDEPAAFHPAWFGDAAAIDLSALWGLPLYRLDSAGQLRPALVREAVVLGQGAAGWEVRLVLCGGSWSDGQPVVAQDVVATWQALRDGPSPWLVASIAEVRVDGPDVVVVFEAPTSRWQHALLDLGSVLPAHVLATQGLDAWRDGVPVSGGAWELEQVEDGLRWRFAAHPDSALGAPATASLEVLLVPRFELALGLLSAGEVDVALGHMALEVGPRVEDRGGLEHAEPRGGSLLTWRWNPDTSLDDPVARGVVHQAFDVEAFADGLLGDAGDVTTSYIPLATGPDVAIGNDLPGGLGELVIAAPRWHEVPSLLARALRDAIEARGGTVRTAGDEADVLARTPLGDAHVVIRRVGPWPSLASWTAGSEVPAGDLSELAAGDLASGPGEGEVLASQQALRRLALEVPLLDVAATHVWSPELEGLEPSAWPGLGFASAANWTIPGE